MIWFPTAIMKPQKHKNHMFIDFFNNLISAHFFSIQMTSCHIHIQGVYKLYIIQCIGIEECLNFVDVTDSGNMTKYMSY